MANSDLQKSILKIDFVEFLPSLTKDSSRKRALSILAATIQSYGELGIENTTYEEIAKRADISRPLLFKYFKDYEDLFYNSVKLIRVHFQQFAVEAFKEAKTPTEKMRAYVQSTFEWIDKHPDFAGVLLLYMHRCSRSARERDFNTQFSETGRMRIAGLIRLAEAQGEAKCADADAAAGLIQTVIAGAMVTSASVYNLHPTAYQKQIQDLCLNIAGFNVKPRKS